MSFVNKRFSSSLVTAIKAQSKSDFENELQKNVVLWKLWSLPNLKQLPEGDSTINASSTLPVIYRTKAAVFKDISKENPGTTGVSLQLKQYTGYAKSIIHFYRVGIQNVWKNRKLVSALKKKYHIESVDDKGHVIQRKIKNGKDLVKVLDSYETLSEIEQDALKKVDNELLLNINRKEFQTILRTERDFFKIPLFALVLMIFAEMTPALCYLFPEIAPSTCLFPNLLKKINKSSINALDQLKTLRLKKYEENYYSKGEYPIHNVWNLPNDELNLLITSLNLKSRYLPIGIYPESLLRQRLNDRFVELKVDNYFFVHGESPRSKLIENDFKTDNEPLENFWSLNKNELLRSCIDRGLIDFNKDDLIHLSSHELKIRLFFHLGLFLNERSIRNVGLLGLNHLDSSNSIFFKNIDKDDALKIYHWWAKK